MSVHQIPFPENSILSENKYDYRDSFCGDINAGNNDATIQEISTAFFLSSPKWIDSLMTLRNKMVSVFGLKTGNELTKNDIRNGNFDLTKGKHVGIFKVYDVNDHELVLGADDKHLNFRASLLLDPQSQNKKKLTISTTVVYNNWFGKLYFLPVKPFHKRIVRSMLNRTISAIEN